jgi:hypothetical protein
MTDSLGYAIGETRAAYVRHLISFGYSHSEAVETVNSMRLAALITLAGALRADDEALNELGFLPY